MLKPEVVGGWICVRQEISLIALHVVMANCSYHDFFGIYPNCHALVREKLNIYELTKQNPFTASWLATTPKPDFMVW